MPASISYFQTVNSQQLFSVPWQYATLFVSFSFFCAIGSVVWSPVLSNEEEKVTVLTVLFRLKSSLEEVQPRRKEGNSSLGRQYYFVLQSSPVERKGGSDSVTMLFRFPDSWSPVQSSVTVLFSFPVQSRKRKRKDSDFQFN